MKISGVVETVETGAISEIQVEAAEYTAGYAQLKAGLADGARLLSVSVDRT